MKKIDFSKYLPVGYEWKQERRLFIGGMVLSALFGSLYFVRLYHSWDRLWNLVWIDGKITRTNTRNGEMMRDFAELFFEPNSLAGFLVVALIMTAFMVVHYVYHYQGSKSIYVMKRLPDKWELYRRCFTVPLIEIGTSLIAALLFLLIGYAVYMKITPPECLAGDQWQKLLNYLFG